MSSNQRLACLQAEAWAAAGAQVTWTNHVPASSLSLWYRGSQRNNLLPIPPIAPHTMMVCYELPLYAAVAARVITPLQLWDMFKTNIEDRKSWLSILKGGWTFTTYNIDTHAPTPSKGDIVFFNEMSHVAMATGTGGQVVSVWGMDPTGITANTNIEITTIEALYSTVQQNTARIGLPTGLGVRSPLGNAIPPLIIKFSNAPW